jgi:gluconate 2-dehydrogenase subunit 3-like protein
MPQSRRTFIRNSGIGLLSFTVAGCELKLTPEDARQQQIPFHVLQPDEVRSLDAFGEVLLPGSAEAGLAHFIDHQLNTAPPEQLLMIKYLGVSAPFAGFYSGGLAALDATASALHGLPFAALDDEQQTRLVARISGTNPDGWSGPPAPFFYFVIRNDAIDVMYGTQSGVESLGIPYMAHIEPPSRWGE